MSRFGDRSKAAHHKQQQYLKQGAASGPRQGREMWCAKPFRGGHSRSGRGVTSVGVDGIATTGVCHGRLTTSQVTAATARIPHSAQPSSSVPSPTYLRPEAAITKVITGRT